MKQVYSRLTEFGLRHAKDDVPKKNNNILSLEGVNISHKSQTWSTKSKY